MALTDDGGQLLGIALDGLLHRFGLGDDVGPLLVLAAVVVLAGTDGEGHGGHVGADAGLHLVPRMLVELADEEELGLRMLQNVLDGVARQRGINWHGDVAGEPNGEVGHEPPAAVLGHEGDAASLLEAEGVEVGRHLEGFVHGLLEGPVLDVGITAAHRLGEEDPVGGLLHPGGEGIEEGRGFGHVGLFFVCGTADGVNEIHLLNDWIGYVRGSKSRPRAVAMIYDDAMDRRRAGERVRAFLDLPN